MESKNGNNLEKNINFSQCLEGGGRRGPREDSIKQSNNNKNRLVQKRKKNNRNIHFGRIKNPGINKDNLKKKKKVLKLNLWKK